MTFIISMRGLRGFLLYEVAPRVLPSYPEVLSAKAQRHLEQLGVKVYTSTRVTSIDADGIIANGQRVPAATVLWSGCSRFSCGAMDKFCYGQIRQNHRQFRSVGP